ncbi:MAG: hypothetical protein MPK62_06515, partial [Alphaproteobacteria bacterium]|nr:hypothetical protein [Alphaproteobacteria bacterium]
MSEGEVTGRVWWLVGCRDGLAVSAGDVEEERVGPFVSYEEARRAWSDRAWSSVDLSLIHI